ncbi:MAG: hypothetical protein IAG10_18710 [Planctomycetaceae bacterium]|nr:hypothetical protein [Planctomycetaceae bacterium]
MAEADISPAVRDFIVEHIDSILQLEVLLLMYADRVHARTAADINREFRIDTQWLDRQLTRMCAAGILNCTTTSDVFSYQYQPTNAEMHDAIAGLVETYATRRVSVVSLIYSKPVDRLKHFADAFRLRKDRNDG